MAGLLALGMGAAPTTAGWTETVAFAGTVGADSRASDASVSLEDDAAELVPADDPHDGPASDAPEDGAPSEGSEVPAIEPDASDADADTGTDAEPDDAATDEDTGLQIAVAGGGESTREFAPELTDVTADLAPETAEDGDEATAHSTTFDLYAKGTRLRADSDLVVETRGADGVVLSSRVEGVLTEVEGEEFFRVTVRVEVPADADITDPTDLPFGLRLTASTPAELLDAGLDETWSASATVDGTLSHPGADTTAEAEAADTESTEADELVGPSTDGDAPDGGADAPEADGDGTEPGTPEAGGDTEAGEADTGPIAPDAGESTGTQPSPDAEAAPQQPSPAPAPEPAPTPAPEPAPTPTPAPDPQDDPALNTPEPEVAVADDEGDDITPDPEPAPEPDPAPATTHDETEEEDA